MKTREYYSDINWTLWLKCSKCLQFKQENNFNKSKKWFLWLHQECRECHNKNSRKHYRDNKEKYLDNVRKRRQNNEDKMILYEKKRREKNPQKIKDIMRKRKKKRNKKYGFDTTKLTSRANHFIKKYSLRPIICPICWLNNKIEFHHVSYDSEDMWCIWVFCCKKCHEKIHSWNIKCPVPINLIKAI